MDTQIQPVNSAVSNGNVSSVPMTPAQVIVSAIRDPKPIDSSSLPNSIIDDASLAQAVAYAKAKLGMADSLFAEAETLLRRSSVSLFYAGQALKMISEYKKLAHGEWTAWLKSYGLAVSSVSEAIRFYKSAIAKWSTLPACEKELSMLNRTQAKIVLEVVKPKAKRKAGTPPTEAEIKVVAEAAAKAEAEQQEAQRKADARDEAIDNAMVEASKPEEAKQEDGTLFSIPSLTVLANYIDDDGTTDDLAIFGLMQIVQIMDDLQPLVSGDHDRKRFTPLLGEIEAKLAKLLVA